jgi:nicotinamide mononucleotide adenylyltransferase
MSKKYALYIGRWQNWHKGHEWLINQQLEKAKMFGWQSEMSQQMKTTLKQHNKL